MELSRVVRHACALVLLTAVLAVHGTACAGAHSSHVGEPAADHLTSAVPSPDPLAALVAAMTLPDDGDRHGDAGSGPGGSTHVLMVCLAVLAGGVAGLLAALAAWLSRRRTGWRRTLTGLARPPARQGAGPPRRAPDLAELCLLRI